VEDGTIDTVTEVAGWQTLWRRGLWGKYSLLAAP